MSKAIAEAEAKGKGEYSTLLYFTSNYLNSTSHLPIFLILNTLYIPLPSSDADKKLANDLMKLAAVDVEDLLSEMKEISKGILFNVQQSLLQEWRPD